MALEEILRTAFVACHNPDLDDLRGENCCHRDPPCCHQDPPLGRLPCGYTGKPGVQKGLITGLLKASSTWQRERFPTGRASLGTGLLRNAPVHAA